jgi:hypothetical protein
MRARQRLANDDERTSLFASGTRGSRHSQCSPPCSGILLSGSLWRSAPDWAASPKLDVTHTGGPVHTPIVRSRARFAAILALLTPFVSSAARAAEPSIDQMLSLRRVSSPNVSPDGRFVAYAVRDTDLVGNTFVTQLWLADVGSQSHPAAHVRSQVEHLARMVAGRLQARVPLRARREAAGVDAGHARGRGEKLTANEEGVTAFAWSPDGQSVAFTARSRRTTRGRTATSATATWSETTTTASRTCGCTRWGRPGASG